MCKLLLQTRGCSSVAQSLHSNNDLCQTKNCRQILNISPDFENVSATNQVFSRLGIKEGWDQHSLSSLYQPANNALTQSSNQFQQFSNEKSACDKHSTTDIIYKVTLVKPSGRESHFISPTERSNYILCTSWCCLKSGQSTRNLEPG